MLLGFPEAVKTKRNDKFCCFSLMGFAMNSGPTLRQARWPGTRSLAIGDALVAASQSSPGH